MGINQIMNTLSILLVPIFGFLIVSAIWPRKSCLENLAYGYLVGWPIFTLSLFLANLLGLRYGMVESSLLLLTGIVLVLTIRALFRVPLTFSPLRFRISSPSSFELTTLGLIAILLSIVLLSDTYRIVGDWDALTLYDFRAHLFAQYGGMQEAIHAQGSYFNSYPLHTSLVHTWYYLLGFISPMTYYGGGLISFVIVFYYSARRVSTRLVSSLAALMLLLAPHLYWHAQIAYTNLPYTITIVMGTILVVQWIRAHQLSDLIMGALLTGISVWIRHPEPFWMTNLFLVTVFSLYHRKPGHFVWYATIFFPFERVWKMFIASLSGAAVPGSLAEISTGLTVVTHSSSLAIILSVIQYLIINIFRPFAPAFLIFATVVLLKIIRRDFFLVAEFAVFSNLTLLCLGTFIFAMTQPYWAEIPGSLQRVSMILTPLIIYSWVSKQRSL